MTEDDINWEELADAECTHDPDRAAHAWHALCAAPPGEPVIVTHVISGRLAEFIAQGVIVHVEATGPAQFWITVTDPATGRAWDISCGAVDRLAPGYATCEEQG